MASLFYAIWQLMLLQLASSQKQSRPPHIVLIVADDLGWNDISWHNAKMKSPNLERLAREGVILDQHYALPICTPTRAALLTGRYPYKLGIQTLIANHVMSTIEKSKQHEPMFLYVAFQAVHAPLQAPSRYRKMCSVYVNTKRKKICEMLAVMDNAVGLLVKKLKEQNMWSNTLFVFISDNGGQVLYGGNNWPLRGNKNTLFEGGTRVPAFVTGPLIKKRGRHSSRHILVECPLENKLSSFDR